MSLLRELWWIFNTAQKVWKLACLQALICWNKYRLSNLIILVWTWCTLPYNFCHNFMSSDTLSYFNPKLRKSTSYVHYTNPWNLIQLTLGLNLSNRSNFWHVSLNNLPQSWNYFRKGIALLLFKEIFYWFF